MQFWIIIFVIFVGIGIFYFLLRKIEKVKKKERYKLRDYVLNKSEGALFLELKKQLPEDFHIFPNMRIADIVYTIKGPDYLKNRNKVWSRHIDFVICNKNFKPLLAIELDGKSHRSEKKQKSDRFKDEFFEEVGIKFERINVGSEFSLDVSRILENLKEEGK